MYDAIVAEQGIPNDVYGDMSRDMAIEQAEEYCWCDKVGGKVIWAGHCSEMHEPDLIVKPRVLVDENMVKEKDISGINVILNGWQKIALDILFLLH
ncbi:hypothetical protein DW954_02840 [Clostridium sp. AM45-5]|nr:hypothetical protein [Clostridium sp. AM45-5]RHS68290.1 hypothetical protein DW954_02840 [Clostridium sp. AM45-5]